MYMHGFLVEETIPFCVLWFVDVIGLDLLPLPLGHELRHNFFGKIKQSNCSLFFPIHLQS